MNRKINLHENDLLLPALNQMEYPGTLEIWLDILYITCKINRSNIDIIIFLAEMINATN